MTERAHDLQAALGVSRETLEQLQIYVGLLKKWTKRINLVAPKSLDQVWTRHILDSTQVFDLAPKNAATWVDLGSGGGFPGAVVAILAAAKAPNLSVTLIESDQRKAAFLRSVARETGVPFEVIAKRIEDQDCLNADIVSARALAPLDQLLGLVFRHMHKDGTALLPKGGGWRAEHASALEHWAFDCKTHQSTTDADAVILEIGEIKRV